MRVRNSQLVMQLLSIWYNKHISYASIFTNWLFYIFCAPPPSFKEDVNALCANKVCNSTILAHFFLEIQATFSLEIQETFSLKKSGAGVLEYWYMCVGVCVCVRGWDMFVYCFCLFVFSRNLNENKVLV